MSRACVLCGFDLAPVELVTCQVCVGLVRLDLTQIRVCFALLPGTLGRPAAVNLGSIGGAGGTEPAIPGGDAVAMLGPGAYSHEGLPADPPAVAFELRSWAGDWCELRHEDPGKVPSDVPGLVAWLGARLGWAMSHHVAAVEVAADLARIRVRLEGATAMSGRPQYGAHCLDCSDVRLVRRYGSETWTCPRCRRAYDGPEMWLAVRADMEADRQRGAMWVTLLEAARAAGRSHRTLRTWVHAGVVSGACRLEDGAALVWLPDVMDATAAAHRRLQGGLTSAAAGR